MVAVEERLATLEERVKGQHDMLVEIKLLLEALQPFQVQTAQVKAWQTTISQDIASLWTDHNALRTRVTALELWRSYLLGGMTVLVLLASTGLITALINYLGKAP